MIDHVAQVTRAAILLSHRERQGEGRRKRYCWMRNLPKSKTILRAGPHPRPLPMGEGGRFLVALTFLLAACRLAGAQTTQPLAVVGETVYTMSGDAIKNGVV